MNYQEAIELEAEIIAFKETIPLVKFYSNLARKAVDESEAAIATLEQARNGYGKDHPITLYLLAEATRLHYEATTAHKVFSQAREKNAEKLAEINAKHAILKAQAA
jgi:hypothetical protein